VKVTLVDFAIAKPFIEQWHYSKCVPKGFNLFFGCYLDERPYAVANYGEGINPYQAAYLREKTKRDITVTNLLELKRLCRLEPRAEGVQLTQFLSKCHQQLKRIGYRYVVSFSDPEHGHTGGIYKAANFTHMGKTNAEWHTVDKDGNPVHRRVAYRHARQNGITIEKAREVLGLTRRKTLPKDRWFITL